MAPQSRTPDTTLRDRVQMSMYAARFLIPASGGGVVAMATLGVLPALSIPTGVLLLVALISFGIGYGARASGEQTRTAIAALTAGREQEQGGDQ